MQHPEIIGTGYPFWCLDVAFILLPLLTMFFIFYLYSRISFDLLLLSLDELCNVVAYSFEQLNEQLTCPQQLCKETVRRRNYYYSSAKFYETGIDAFIFLKVSWMSFECLSFGLKLSILIIYFLVKFISKKF
jgi:hypothetical protein